MSIGLQIILIIFFLVWQVFPGEKKQIDVGHFGVWGVSTKDDIYKKTSTDWEKVPGSLKDISVGKNSVWGANKNNDIYKRVGEGNWQRVLGKLRQV